MQFRPYNLKALGTALEGGHLHPLLKVRAQIREIFLEMGYKIHVEICLLNRFSFEEMPTNNFVENSFWNFDSLFQPQQHPARDAHDTFFLSGIISFQQMAVTHRIKILQNVWCYQRTMLIL